MSKQEILANLRRRVETLSGAETHIPIAVEWVRELVADDSPDATGEASDESRDPPKRRNRKPKPSE